MTPETFKASLNRSREVTINQKFKQTALAVASERLDEIDKLVMKVECAMKLNESPYMQKKFNFQYKCLKQNRAVNEMIISTLGGKDEI